MAPSPAAWRLDPAQCAGPRGDVHYARITQRESVMLQQNVGSIDRTLRIVIGLVLLSLIFIGPRTWWGLVGVIPLATAMLKTCPLHTLLGVNTCPRS
jgi:hypothetical protein